MTISVREYEDSDLDEVLEVMRLSLGETDVLQRTAALFAWKHRDNPFGRSIMLVATDGSRIAGFRAFMRWSMVDPEGTTLKCVRPVDTATHPEYRRRGIFRTLTETAIEQASADGVDLVFNTPNPQSGAGYLKMGWEAVGEVGVMVRPRIRFGGGDHVVGSHPVAASGVPDRAPLGLRTQRSNAYRMWRFASHPTATYAQFGSATDHLLCRLNRRNGRKEIVVSDAVGDPRVGLRELTRFSRAHYHVAWFTSSSPERRALLRRGFVPVPNVRALTLVVRPLSEVASDPTNLAGWDIGLGDLELL